MNQRMPIEDLPSMPYQGMPTHMRLFLLIAFFGPTIYYGYEGDFVLAALIGSAGLSAFSGFRIGATAMIASVIAITAAVAYAPSIAYAHEFRFTEWFGTTGLLNRVVSIGSVGLGITVLASLLVMLVTRGIYRRRPGLDRSNRWLGLWIGAIEGVVLVFFALGGALVLEPIEQSRADSGVRQTERGKRISKWVLATAANVHQSEAGPYIETYNPFVQFPELNKIEEVQKSVQILSDPKKIEKLINHPEVKQLQSRPEVRTAVRKVLDAPDIREALNSGGPMNRRIAMTLLNHPAILELIDQPGFVEVATKAIRSTNLLKP